MAGGLRTAVVGGGWAGVAAAIEATHLGHAVTLFEMAPQLGGRARSFEIDGIELDNGQHIGIGAYSEMLSLMQRIGVDPAAAFLRSPLRLGDASGAGLFLPSGPPVLAFVRAVLARRGWRWRDKSSLLAQATLWALQGYRCDPTLTVSDLAGRTTRAVRQDLIDPLCIAALNTEADAASASVFLRVLKDSLFAGPGSSDLLLPRQSLGRLLPAPAHGWLRAAGVPIHLSHRVERLQPHVRGWLVDADSFDRVVLATTAVEAARLTATFAADWSRRAAALRYEPIVTLYLRSAGSRLCEPMLVLPTTPEWPAQFVFDRGQLGGPEGLLAFVISGAQRWVEQGSAATLRAVRQQAEASLGSRLASALEVLKVVTEQRATFRCVPGIERPAQAIAPGLAAAGDFVDGPYPATLEGAVRSGINAARRLQ